MPREIKRDARKRAAVAEQKRQKRAQLTEEELREVRAVAAERARQNRARMTEEELEKFRARNAAKSRKKRLALLSDQNLKKQLRSAEAERTRQKRAQMTEEQLEKRRARDAANKREKRLAIKSAEELQLIRARDNERKRQKREKMTEEDLEKEKAQRTEWTLRKKAGMTEEDLKRRHAEKKEYLRQRLARMPEEEKERMRAKQSDRRKGKESGTTVARIQGWISQAANLAHRHPLKYEVPGTFIKNSFCEILNLHTEVLKLRKDLRQTVADAVQNTLNLHQTEKQTRAVIENQKSDHTYENSTKHDTDVTFKVSTYDSAVGASDEISAEKKNSVQIVCPICSKKFWTCLGLTIHQKEHANGSGEFKCSSCPQMFQSYKLMTTHYLQDHSLEFDANAISFETEAEEPDEVLERHRHEFEFSLLRKCLVCFQTFERPGLSTYSHHIISDHSDNKELLKHFTYTCARCDKHFSVLRSLECHWKTFCYEKWKNEENRGIMCEKCGMKFSNDRSLISHERISHTEKEKVVCEQCGKEFNTEKLLNRHVKAMHEAAYDSFTCEHCGKTFRDKQNLKKHTKIIHLGEKRFVCTLCDKRFESNYKLDHHMITHTGEKLFRPSKYGCDICGKTFKSPAHLKAHKYTHDDLKRFGCSLCEAKFRQRNSHNKHIKKVHANENAQIVILIPEKNILANRLPLYNDISSTLHNPSEIGNPGVANMDLELQYSPERNGYSPEVENANEIIEIEIPLLQFEAGELGSVNQQNNISLSGSTNAGNSTDLKHPVFETNIKSVQKSIPHSSSFIDFSRANVPLGLSNLTDDATDIELEKPKTISKPKVVNVDIKDVSKLKTEDGIDEASPKVIVRNEAEIFAQENASPCPIVKLSKLLEYKCVPCERTIFATNQREIRKHRRTHRSGTSVPRGNKPRKATEKKSSTNKVTKLKISSFDCLYCEMKMSGKKMVVHCAKEHPGQQPIKCPVCPRMFNSIHTYYNHKTKRHNAPKPKPPRDPNAKKEIICQTCGKEFHTKDGMYSHRYTMHREDRNVECDICHKIIQGKHNLKLHRQRHTGIKSHLCEECGLGFVTTIDLNKHVRQVHRGENKTPKNDKTHPFPCPLCPYRFVKEIGLQKHLDLHDPQRKYECDECGLRFKTYDNRFAHIKLKHKNIKYIRKRKQTPPADMSIIIPKN